MSDKTLADLEQAIAAHMTETSDEGAVLVTGWVLQIAGKTTADLDEGAQTTYLREVPEGQSPHITLGLIDYCHTMFRTALNERDDD